ncbi:DUF4175 domain-containing protein [Gluconacetobacter entanii]|uniref:DUF4175 domain-containing protein n=1 Tax=Gluconacetobacter entanii TaxID=108528 RepID=A0A318PZL0_9PROT|nr:DUF4175 domain-containing protein [Gluconacetobacter entanii]PYD63922.1 hypothetical protein CFR72_04330 [Gluconacetobacter entanii]
MTQAGDIPAGTPARGPTTASVSDMSSFATRLARVRVRTRRVLWVERLWPIMLPIADVAGGVALLGLLRIPQRLPDGVHAAALLALGAGCAAWGLRRYRQGHAPDDATLDRRIEQASGLADRPLQTLLDTPARTSADPAATRAAEALWRIHLQRTGARIGRLKAGWPRLWPVGRETSWATLALAPLLAIGLIWAGPSAPGRIGAAFIPGTDDAEAPRPQIHAWITMPSYAPGAPVFLDERRGTATVPAGAVLSVTVTGLHGTPVLRARPATKGASIGSHTFHALDPANWSVEAPLLADGALSLRGRGRVLSQWDLKVTPNPAPLVTWGANPGATDGEWRTRLPYKVSQPYGIASLRVEMRLPGDEHVAHARVLSVPIPLNGHPHSAEAVATPDLSSDPWAGEDVIATLVATSDSGMSATSAPVHFRLGARVFHNPMAKALLDIRKRLALGRESRFTAGEELHGLGMTSAPMTHSPGLMIALSSVSYLLSLHEVDTAQAIEQAVGRLWYLALDVEHDRHDDIANSQADFDIQMAEEALDAQIEHMREPDGKPTHSAQAQAELQRRVQALKDAIQRKMQALMEQAMRDNSAIPAMPEMSQTGEQNLSRMMQQLQEDAANGRSADALDRLHQMEDMASQMRNATPQDIMQAARQYQAQQDMREQQAALRDLIHQQSTLLDHTQQRIEQDAASAAARQTDMDTMNDDEDLSNLSTPELLRRLGLTPSGQQASPQKQPPPAESQTPEAHEEQQHADRATQHALARALHELQKEFKTLSGKDVPALKQALSDMKAVRTALTAGKDPDAATAERKVLADLQKGGQQMRQSAKGSGKGMTIFLPSLAGSKGSGGSKPGQPDEEETHDSASKEPRDPLGRKTGDGNAGMDSDTHVPDKAARERAREIEQELRRRDSDRTRPPEELQYLDRLLQSF